MQPYFFPYLGYYQLAATVDHFVFFDDVAFIKKGYIQRNRILLDGRAFDFSIPVSRQSQNRTIREHWFTGAFTDFLEQLRHAYVRAPFFGRVFPIIEEVCLDPQQNVASKAARSIQVVFDYLGLPFSSSFSSADAGTGLHGEQRILDLCSRQGADVYYNPIGGRSLYSGERFSERGFTLGFLQSRMPAYAQASEAFMPGLSMIDVLMNVEAGGIHQMLSEFDLVAA